MKKIALSIISILAFVSAWAQLNFVGNTDKNALSYKCGEDINFTIQLFDGDKIKEEFTYNKMVNVLNTAAELVQGDSRKAVEYLLNNVSNLSFFSIS